MSGIRTEVDLERYERYGRRLADEMATAVKEGSVDIQRRVVEEITRQGLVDTGNLRDSVQITLARDQTRSVGIVGTSVLYAVPLELGVKKRFYPSSEMVESLQGWARRKLGLTPAKAKVAGSAIAWKIARKGIKARHFFERGTKAALPGVQRLFERRFKRLEQEWRTGEL